MIKFEFRPQSYKRAAWELQLPEGVLPSICSKLEPLSFRGHLEIYKDGNKTILRGVINPDDRPVAVMPFRWSGTIASDGECILALADGGSWSGGQNWAGALVGREGAKVVCDTKGRKQTWGVVAGYWQEVTPAAEPDAIF